MRHRFDNTRGRRFDKGGVGWGVWGGEVEWGVWGAGRLERPAPRGAIDAPHAPPHPGEQ